MREYEILAPAGNMEALKSAVNNGANAVYLGLDSFNARMKADNFTLDNLAQIVDYCHLFGVKVYVAINTSIKQEEFLPACQMITNVYNANADGVILSDLALIKFAGKFFLPPFEIVASTQLNIHDLQGVQYVKNLGATTVVLAREVSSATIKHITANCDIKIECFIHGALCVCQSGQCLFSSMVGGNSGNRGLCAQPCRQFYNCIDSKGNLIKDGYLLSPKDWCGADVAKEMYQNGVSVYKIEGRNRRSQYAGGASKFYADLFAHNFQYSDEQLIELKKLYNRGDYLTEGYYKGYNQDIIYPKVQGHIGVVVGSIVNGKLRANTNINNGDAFKILHNGYECGSAVALESGKIVKLSTSGQVKDGDTVCITTDIEQLQRIDNAQKTIAVSLYVKALIGLPLEITAKTNDCEVNYQSSFICPKADKTPTTEQEITLQLSKVGDTQYTITDIVLYSEQVFLPKSVINALRRDVLERLTQAIILQYNDKLKRTYVQFVDIKDRLLTMFAGIDEQVDKNTTYLVGNNTDKFESTQKYSNSNNDNTINPKLAVVCYNLEQFEQAITNKNIDTVIVKTDTINCTVCKQYDEIANKKWYFDIPSFTNATYVQKCIAQCKNIALVAHNVSTVELCQRLGIDYLCGTGLNIFNSFIANVLTDNFKHQFVYSQELTLKEIDDINLSGYTFVDGQLVLMKFVHCPYKLCYNNNCNNCKFDTMTYKDKKGNKFFIKRRKADICTFELINGVKLSANNKCKQGGNYLIDFEPSVVEYFVALKEKQQIDYPLNVPYTKGRLFDKVK